MTFHLFSKQVFDEHGSVSEMHNEGAVLGCAARPGTLPLVLSDHALRLAVPAPIWGWHPSPLDSCFSRDYLQPVFASLNFNVSPVRMITSSRVCHGCFRRRQLGRSPEIGGRRPDSKLDSSVRSGAKRASDQVLGNGESGMGGLTLRDLPGGIIVPGTCCCNQESPIELIPYLP